MRNNGSLYVSFDREKKNSEMVNITRGLFPENIPIFYTNIISYIRITLEYVIY